MFLDSWNFSFWWVFSSNWIYISGMIVDASWNLSLLSWNWTKSIIKIKAHRVKSSDYITDVKIRAVFLRNKLLILCLDVEFQVKMLRICIIPSLFLLSCGSCMPVKTIEKKLFFRRTKNTQICHFNSRWKLLNHRHLN